MRKTISNTLLVAGIILLVVFIQRKFFPTTITETIHTSDTIWQDTTIIKFKIDTVYKPYYVKVFQTDTVTLPVDSAGIAEAYLELYSDFYSTYYYNDTLQDDSIALAVLNYEISQNKPKYNTFKNYSKKPSVINNTTTIYANRPTLYLKGQLGVNHVAPGLMLETGKGYVFELSYDFVGQDRGVLLEAGVPIWSKK